MLKLVIRRLLAVVPMLLLVSIVVFFLFSLVPIDAAAVILGDAATAEQRAVLAQQLGLDRPLLERLGNWLSGAVVGDFGDSYLTRRPVAPELLDRMPATLSLAFGGLVVGLFIGIPVGVIAAQRPNSILDRGLTTVVSILLAMPGFWLALILVLVFAVQLRWFPVVGYTPFAQDPLEWARKLVLPWLAMGSGAAASIARQTRSAMLDTLESTYVRAAIARGASRGRAVYVYALKNALVPVLAVVGMQLAVMIGISFVLERIFSIPGAGTLMLDALLRGDIPMLQGAVVLIAAAIILINMLVDVGYGILNPKVRPQ